MSLYKKSINTDQKSFWGTKQIQYHSLFIKEVTKWNQQVKINLKKTYSFYFTHFWAVFYQMQPQNFFEP